MNAAHRNFSVTFLLLCAIGVGLNFIPVAHVTHPVTAETGHGSAEVSHEEAASVSPVHDQESAQDRAEGGAGSTAAHKEEAHSPAGEQ